MMATMYAASCSCKSVLMTRDEQEARRFRTFHLNLNAAIGRNPADPHRPQIAARRVPGEPLIPMEAFA